MNRGLTELGFVEYQCSPSYLMSLLMSAYLHAAFSRECLASAGAWYAFRASALKRHDDLAQM
jgi:predicted small integral membrane protein